jgi:hypothetical protein
MVAQAEMSGNWHVALPAAEEAAEDDGCEPGRANWTQTGVAPGRAAEGGGLE